MRDNTTFRRGAGGSAARSKRAGLTLVELMVSITIVMIAVAGSIASQISADRLVQTGQQTSAASADLQSCMERLRLWSYSDLELVLRHPNAADAIGNDAFVPDPPASTADTALTNYVALLDTYDDLHLQGQVISAAFPNFALGGAVPDPLEIRLTCRWTDHQGRGRQLQLSSLKTK
ncbi:MAG: prepilin-type N-terminal cleavage/methylation domain-containing protein [Planctomycetes bacterium]|nr:prepilin-type N-terminal cleavage/methylation domain-containing protein [Planctomycetota bacterium]